MGNEIDEIAQGTNTSRTTTNLDYQQGIVTTAAATIDFQAMPEGCIANMLSFTNPVDTCRLALVSTNFFSASQSDEIWDRFLPSDLESIVSESSEPSLIATSPSKKDLYLRLSDHHILVDQGRKSFQLDKGSGKKCYMISARGLDIVWGDTPEYWNWIAMPDSRFEEVAKLVAVCWFHINGKINTRVLSQNTEYAVYLVFKLIDARGFDYHPAELSVGITGEQSHTKKVCLDPNLKDSQLPPNFRGLERPILRSDGWLEIEMGKFFNSGIEDDEVNMIVAETKSNWWKHGFFLQGIEVRPKFP